MLDCWLWDLVDCMRHEEEKIAGNTRDRGEKQGRARRPYPRSPGRRCSATGFCARGRMSWYEYNIYSKTYTEGSDPFYLKLLEPGESDPLIRSFDADDVKVEVDI